MPRNISFALTTEQIRNRTKTVTRRLGWKTLKKGEILNGCVKCMGLKPGEKIERLGQIRILSAVPESLLRLFDEPYGSTEAAKEGFPDMNGAQFVKMFCDHMRPVNGCATEVTRIEFEYIDADQTSAIGGNDAN